MRRGRRRFPTLKMLCHLFSDRGAFATNANVFLSDLRERVRMRIEAARPPAKTLRCGAG
jgi:hypothetical protein